MEKFRECGNERLLICERGSNFGYDNLVVDMLGFGVMKRCCDDLPIFDVTHALQCRDPGGSIWWPPQSGRRPVCRNGGRTSRSVLEAHPDPDNACCDGPSALPLAQLEPFLRQAKAIDDVVKAMPAPEIR